MRRLWRMCVWCRRCSTPGVLPLTFVPIPASWASMPPAGSCSNSKAPLRNARFERPAGGMTISLETIPSFTAAEALTLATEHYGLRGTVRSLPSERDQNFLITDAFADRFVLKIANSGDAPSLLDFQNQAMRRVAGLVADCRVPRVVASLKGADITAIQNSRTGTGHCVRLMAWLDGEVLANCASRGPALFDSIGASLGKIDAALSGFTH